MRQRRPAIKFKSNKIKLILLQNSNPQSQQQPIIPNNKTKTMSMGSLRETDDQTNSKKITSEEHQPYKPELDQRSLLEILYQHLIRDNIQTQQESNFEQNEEGILQEMLEEIQRLQQIQFEFVEFNRLLQKSSRKNSNEQKWKIVVLTYKQKLKKYDSKIEEEHDLRVNLQKVIEAQQEQINRLNYLNSIKLQKINTIVEDLQTSHKERQEIYTHQHTLQNHISILRQRNQENAILLDISMRKNEDLQNQLLTVTQQLQEITHHFSEYKEKTIIAQSHNQQVVSSILTKQCSTQQQIHDLKEKYQNQIDLLENKLRSYLINQQELQLKILDLQSSLNHRQSPHFCQVYVQTQEETTTKACYFSTLAEQFQNNESLEDYNQFTQDTFHLDFNASREDHNSSFGSNHNHKIKMNTERQRQLLRMQRYSEPDEQQYRCGKSVDLSFEQQLSMSNASRYTQSLQQLSSELGSAYQKINELSSKLSLMQSQNVQLRRAQQQRGLSVKRGLLGSFFKR